MSNHTPTPWKFKIGVTYAAEIIAVSKRGKEWVIARITGAKVGSSEAEANAEFVVRACNSHYDLLEACQEWIAERDNPSPCWVMKQQAEKKMRAAITKATGKEKP